MLRVDGNTSEPLEVGETVTLTSLEGPHTVELTDVSPNCSAVDGPMKTVTVVAGELTELQFEVSCVAPAGLASLRIFLTREELGGMAILLMNTDGSGRTRLGAVSQQIKDADLSPDGRKVASLPIPVRTRLVS